MAERRANLPWEGGNRASQAQATAARRRELAARLSKKRSAERDEVELPVETPDDLSAETKQGELSPSDTGSALAAGQELEHFAEASLTDRLDTVQLPVSLGSVPPISRKIAPTSASNDSLQSPVPPWLAALGQETRAGIPRVAEDIKATAGMPPGSVLVSLSWPSPPPSALLAWAVSHLGCGAGEDSPPRILLVGTGRADFQLLSECRIDRAHARALWTPDIVRAVNPMRDAMACAFLPWRLKPGAPTSLPVSSLVPLLHARADSECPWAVRWLGYMNGAREFLHRDHGGQYGFPWHRYGDTATTRPFAFVLPKVSRSTRRVAEIESIPGGIDLVIADFSASWLWPSRVAEEVSDLLLDAAAAAGRGPIPRFLVIVSDPRARIAALGAIQELQVNEILLGRRESSLFHYVGDRRGSPVAVGGGSVPRLRVHTASTTEADIQTELLELASGLKTERPKTAEAIRQAVTALTTMASSIAPPLADTEDPEVMRTFVDAAQDVRSVMSEEGEPSNSQAVHAALRKGIDAATRLMRSSPARIALDEAHEEAATGLRVVFVADSDIEAKQAAHSAPENLLVVSRRTPAGEIAGHCPDVLVIACRGVDAVRILAEQPILPRDVVLLLPPFEAMTAGRIAELVLERSELAPAHALCAQMLESLPPRFSRLPRDADLTSRSPRRKMPAFTGGGARDGVQIMTDDGEIAVFAPGAILITLVDGVPRAKRAADVEEGTLVVIMPEDMADRVARELGWDGQAALLDDQVRRYKAKVREWRNGPGAMLSMKHIQALMHGVDPDMPEPSADTIRYWLSAGDAEEVAAPRASSNLQWLSAFFKVIGLDDADRVFVHFEDHRGRLQRAGHLRTGLLERFLFDPFDAVVQRGVSPERARKLREIAMDSGRVVISVDFPRRGERR